MKEEGFGLPDRIKEFRSALLTKGFDKAELVLNDLRKIEPAFQLKENELNGWAYGLLRQKKIKEAVAIFRLNVKLYPQSANTWDSLGEIMEITENNSEALINYKKSLELNPGNKNALERIKVLSGN